VVIEWPSGKTEDHNNLATGKSYQAIETKGITELPPP
jgi:hypothetical protein